MAPAIASPGSRQPAPFEPHAASLARPGRRQFTVARIGLVALLLAAPLAFGAVDAWAWGVLTLASITLLVLWAVGCARDGMVRLVWSPLYLPAALLILIGMVHLLARRTLDPIGTRESVIKLAADITLFFLATQLFAAVPRDSWRRLGLAVTIFAFTLALFAILQFFSNPTLIYWTVQPRWGGWIFGPYVNHNHYAGLAEMLIPLSAGFALSRPYESRVGGVHRLGLALAVLVPVASVLLSGSRGGLVALTVEAAIFVAAVMLPAKPAGSRRGAAGPAALALAAAACLFFWLDPGDVAAHLETLAKPADFTEKTFGERKVVALDTLHMFRDHPALGTGLGSFEVAYTPYQSFPSDERWEHAHDDFAEALAETGVAGGVAILAALVLFFRLAFERQARSGQAEGDTDAWLQLGASVGCCGLLVHSLFDFNLHIPANAAWFAASAAWATCPRILDSRSNWRCISGDQ